MKAPLLLCLLGAAACDCGRGPEATAPSTPPAAAPERRVPAAPAEEDPRGAAGPGERGCEVGTPTLLENVEGPTPPVGIATAGERGLVARAVDADTLRLHPVDGEGAPRGEAQDVALPAADSLFALQPAGDGFVAVTSGPCDGPEAGCFHALALGPGGDAIGSPVSVPRRRPRTARVRSGGGSVWIAHADRAGEVRLDELSKTATGLVPRRTTLRPADGAHVEVLGLAVDGARWAVVHRVGAVEDPEGEVLLSTRAGTREIHALHEALVLETLRWHEDRLVAVASFEFSRARLFHVDVSGETEGVETLRAGEPLPEVLADARSAAAAFSDGSLSLVIRDGAGDRRRQVVIVRSVRPEVPHRGDVTRTTDGWVVAFSGPEANGFALGTVRIACP